MVLGIIVLFIGTSVIPGIKGDNAQTDISNQSNEPTIDWWPMFHHDPSLNGKSNSSGPETNTVRWWYKILGDDIFSPVVADHKVYVGSSNDNLYCFSAENGKKIWQYSPIGTCILTTPAVAQGKIYFGSPDGNLSCLNATTGIKVWDFKPNAMADSPTIADGKVFFGSRDNNVYCLNAETGEKIWNFTAGWIISTAIAVVDGKVYFGSHNWDVYCLNVTTGKIIWKFMTHTCYLSSPAVWNGMVFIGSLDDKLYCLNSTNGSKIWEQPINGGSSPAIADDKVFIGSRDNKIYCLNAYTGEEYWNYTTGDWVKSSPAIADRKIYIGSDDHKVYCLNYTTGTLVWDYMTSNNVSSSPAIADDKMYIGSKDGTLFCFSGEEQCDLIMDIVGGLGINAFIKNKGTIDAYGVEWQIHIEGGIFGVINKTINDTIDIVAGKSKIVRTGLFFGFGPINITVKITHGEIIAQGAQFLFFTIIKRNTLFFFLCFHHNNIQ